MESGYKASGKAKALNKHNREATAGSSMAGETQNNEEVLNPWLFWWQSAWRRRTGLRTGHIELPIRHQQIQRSRPFRFHRQTENTLERTI